MGAAAGSARADERKAHDGVSDVHDAQPLSGGKQDRA
jgi:hypothetical protein